MGLFTWMKPRRSEDSASESARIEPSISEPKRTRAPLPDERRRSLGPIGCADVLPPSPSFREEAERKEKEAIANGAIAGVWHSSPYYAPYGGVDHPERNQKIYLIRNSWAEQKGLVRPAIEGYTDEITAPCEELGCQCDIAYIFHLGRLPVNMLTQRGKTNLDSTRKKMAKLEEIYRKEYGKDPTLRIIKSYSVTKKKKNVR